MIKNNYCSLSWINEAPNEWKSTRLGYISQCYGRIGFRGYTEEDLVGEGEGPITLSPSNIIDNKLDLTNCSYISWDKYYESPEIQIHNKDILLVKTASVGKCTIYNSNEIATLNPQIVVLKNIKINYKYLYYYLTSDCIQIPIQLDCVGGVIKTITQKNIFDYKILLPNAKEQKLIADFLDDRIEKIDVMLNKLNNQIVILKKYRKSLIKETVTKGLSTNVKMKKSEIDWIGDIPKHWEIYYLKHLFKMFAGGDINEYDFSEEYSEVTPYPIYSNSLENNGLFGYMSKYRFSGNTFTVTGRGDVGKAIARNNKYYPIVRLLVCIPLFEDDTRYYSYCVNSADLLGEQTAMAQLTTQKLGINKFPRPPIYEQKKIADYLDKKCKEIDELVEDKEQQIEKMEQYKKSLIYEYVTGKKRVKGAEELYG